MPEHPAKRIERDFGLTPVIATEIEFYLHGAAKHLAEQRVVSLIETECAKAGIALACAEAERGPDQYEVSLLPARNLSQIISDTEHFKALISSVFAPHGVRADFSAKPMRNAPGSGLHVHVHLEDKQGRNVFFCEDETFSRELLYSIGGMLALMNPCMSVFAPYPESYERFIYTVNAYLICPTAANIPLTVSWGTNNRTVAVRLPTKPADNKHIEHRVAGSDADVSAVIAAILAGIHYGLTQKCNPGEPIYGDATLAQYGLPKLVLNLEAARHCFEECMALKKYFIKPS